MEKKSQFKVRDFVCIPIYSQTWLNVGLSEPKVFIRSPNLREGNYGIHQGCIQLRLQPPLCVNYSCGLFPPCYAIKIYSRTKSLQNMQQTLHTKNLLDRRRVSRKEKIQWKTQTLLPERLNCLFPLG